MTPAVALLATLTFGAVDQPGSPRLTAGKSRADGPAVQRVTNARAAVDSGRVLVRRNAVPTSGGRAVEVNTYAARLDALTRATAWRLVGRYRDADPVYQRLLGMEAARREDTWRVAALGQVQSLLVRWMPDSALSLARQLIAEARESGDRRSEGEALLSASAVFGRRGMLDSARSALDRAGELLPPESPGGIQRLCTVAMQLRAASVRAADSVLQRGLALARAAADSATLARCLLSSGIVLEAQGYQTRSGEALTEAMRIASSQGDADLLASIEQWQAYQTVTYASDFGAARRYAERAIMRAERMANPVTVAWARLNLSQVAMRVGDAALAHRISQLAQRDFRRLGDRNGEMSVLVIQAQASVLAGELQDGIAMYARAESSFRAMGLASATPALSLRRVMALADLGEIERASSVLDSTFAVATRANLPGILSGSIPYARGRVELRRGRMDAAVAAFQQFKVAIGRGSMHNLLDADWRIAEALALSGRLAAAESVFVRGSVSLDALRSRVREREDALGLLSGLRYDSDPDVGVATIIDRLAVGGRLQSAFAIAEAERARWLWVQRSRRGAMRDGGTAAEALNERMLDIEEVQGRLDDRTAVVSFVVGRGGEPTTSFVIWRGGVRTFSLSPVDSLTRDIDRFVSLLQEGANVDALSRQLGSRLLDRAIAVLPTGVSRLRLVPDGQLHHIPFDALTLADGRLLLDRFVTSAAASVRLAVATSESAAGREVLAFGDPVFDSRYALSRLQGSADEVHAILRAVGGRGSARLRQAATSQALREAPWSRVGVLHLATHARVQDFGLLDNAFFLSATATSDGRVGAEDLVEASLPVDLVVLSACRTVGGFVATGEGVQGLVAPVLEAGARAVAVTFWDIRDRSLIGLMEDFYRGLARGDRAADALTAAKRAARRRGLPTTTWAALTIIGDGEVRPLVRVAGSPAAAASPTDGPFRRAVSR